MIITSILRVSELDGGHQYHVPDWGLDIGFGALILEYWMIPCRERFIIIFKNFSSCYASMGISSYHLRFTIIQQSQSKSNPSSTRPDRRVPYFSAIALNASTTPGAALSNPHLSLSCIFPSTYLLTTFGSLLSGLPIPIPTLHHFTPPSCC